jgi:hypothetical protein
MRRRRWQRYSRNWLRRLLDDVTDQIAAALIAAAKRKRPDVAILTFVRDTTEGRPMQALELSGEFSIVTKRETIARRRAERLNGDR